MTLVWYSSVEPSTMADGCSDASIEAACAQLSRFRELFNDANIIGWYEGIGVDSNITKTVDIFMAVTKWLLRTGDIAPNDYQSLQSFLVQEGFSDSALKVKLYLKEAVVTHAHETPGDGRCCLQ